MAKKKAKKIDRSKKTYRILGKRVRSDIVCGAVLVIVLVISSFAFMTNRLTAPQDQAVLSGQARVVITFSDFERNATIVNLTKEMTASEAFDQLVDIQGTRTQTGFNIDSVTFGSKTLANNETHMWIFYLNGALSFKDITQYRPQHADTLELVFEENPY